MPIPEIKINLDGKLCNELRKLVKDHVEHFSEREDSDDVHYIYEAAVEMFYGKDIWKYINEML